MSRDWRQIARPLVAACVAGFAGSCGADGGSGVVLRFVVGRGAPRPQYLLVTWIGPEVRVSDQRFPAQGNLPETGGLLGTMGIEVDRKLQGERRVIARGMREERQVAVGAQPISPTGGGWRDVTVTLQAE